MIRLTPFLLVLASAMAAQPQPSLGEIRLAAPSGAPVPWSRDAERTTFYLGCGGLEFRNEKQELRVTDQTYFYAWQWHYQWREFHFHILEAIDGTLPRIEFVDLNGDGIEEVILKNVAGAYTHVWHIYQRVGRDNDLKKIGKVSSDVGKILVTDQKTSGYCAIEAWERGYDEQRSVTRTFYSFSDGHYQKR